MPTLRQKIHIWTPGLDPSQGGIQGFSRYFVEAVQQSFPNHDITVFVKNDKPYEQDHLLNSRINIISLAVIPQFLRIPLMAMLGTLVALVERPSILVSTHLHFLPALRIIARITGSKYGTVLHGVEAWNLNSKPRIQALQKADFLTSVSQFTAERVRSKFLASDVIIDITPNTFNEISYTPGEPKEDLYTALGLSRTHKIILTVGRISSTEAYKGHDRVIESLPAVLKSHPDSRYLIVGDGDDRKRLENLARQLNVLDYVVFSGKVTKELLPEIYKLCDVFVMPSTGEGFGIVYLEALATGKPVIASNKDAAKEALLHGDLGLLIDPDNINALSTAIVNILNKNPQDAKLVQPEFLRTSAIVNFGFNRFVNHVRLALTKQLDAISTNNTNNSQNSSEQPSARLSSVSVKKFCVTILTRMTSPYQVELFNEIASKSNLHIQVIYLTDWNTTRSWESLPIHHKHIIIRNHSWLKSAAIQWIQNAHYSIFTFYTDRFALKCIQKRFATGKPWCFWGERPGVKQLGVFGLLFRRLSLRRLHQSRAPIWGIGRYALEGYRKEYGENRAYFNMPYFSNILRFQELPFKQGEPFTFLFSGRFVHRKGIDLLLEVFSDIVKQFPQCKLLITGDGPLEGLVCKTAADLPNNINWLGFTPWKDLPSVYGQADCLVAPSLYDGWGMIVPEALAAGLPVISTDRTGAALELIKHNENGWVIKHGDQAQLIKAMLTVLSLDSNKLNCMKESARRSIKLHSLSNGAKLFEELVIKGIENQSEVTT